MKLTTITILSSDVDADSAQRIYDKGEPDAVWQAFQALMTNPDNVLTFGSASATEEQFQYAGWREQIESRNSEIATLRTQLAEQTQAAKINSLEWQQRVESLKSQLAESNVQVAAMREALLTIRDHEPPFLGTDCRLVAGRALGRADRLSTPKPEQKQSKL